MSHTARTSSRAFTLIEVLVATIILGLGVLGLSALFAGAATQQQSAAQVSRSVAFTQAGVGLLGDKLSSIANAGGGGTLPEGVWDAMVSDDPSTRIGGVLRTSFASFPLSSSDQFGFLTPATSGAFGTIEGGLSPGVSSLPNTPLRHDRVWIGDGFEITIRFYNGVFGQGQQVRYSMDLEDDPALQQFLMGNAPPPNSVSLWWNGEYRDPAAPGDFVTLSTGFGGGTAAITGSIRVPNPPSGGAPWQVAEIVSAGYRWFDDLLVSINDRTQYIPSETVPGGRQPVMSFHVLYRETQGQAEVAIVTYALRALSAPRNRQDELPFVPPDTRADFANDEAVLREVQVRLGRDSAANYYIVPVNPADAWIVESGQILIMSSIDGAASAPTAPGAEPDPGADTPVRVLTVRTVNGERRAILEDSPRIGSRSVLENPDETIDIHVWAVAPIVRSRSSDETEWQLTPVEASTFKLVY